MRNERRELKIILPPGLESEFLLSRIESFLKVQHSPRWLNSIYYDTPALDDYRDNIDGISDRIKYRLRWYGAENNMTNVSQSRQFELKIKKNSLGYKKIYLLPQFIPLYSKDDFFRLNLSNLDFPLQSRIPTIQTSYFRQYYYYKTNSFRVTLDSNLKFYNFSSVSDWLPTNFFHYHSKILEIKFNNNMVNLASSLLHILGLRYTRFSKYVTGIQLSHSDIK